MPDNNVNFVVTLKATVGRAAIPDKVEVGVIASTSASVRRLPETVG